jgi:phosphomannomutase
LEHFGAKVEVIDYSIDRFIPVDTDAVVPEVIDNMKKWTEDFKLDFMMSTDGDGDRPLLTDEKGDIVRSELLPMLAAKYLGIEAVASTITACTVLEKTSWFDKIVRTKVGSPFIVEAMEKLSHEYKYVSGYELNGGFFLNNDIVKNGKIIRKLVTRDAVLPILSTLALASEQNKLVSQLVNELPQRFTYSQSVKEIPTQKSLDILANYKLYMSDIENVFGNVVSINELDGLRLTFENDDVVHFRPSKNAPEFRNYTDSSSFESAKILSDKANDLVLKWCA